MAFNGVHSEAGTTIRTDVTEGEATARAMEPDKTNGDVETYENSFFGGVCCAVVKYFLSKWFVFGMAAAVGLAAAAPELGKEGSLIRSEYTIKIAAVALLFLTSGMSLETRVVLQAMACLHLHVLSQAICFGLAPVLGWGVSCILRFTHMNKMMIDGLVIAACMPTTIAANVIYTRQAGGNEAATLTNVVIGNVLGIFICPALLLAYLSKSGQAPFQTLLAKLAMTVLAPLVGGQAVQFLMPKAVRWLKTRVWFGKIGLCIVLLLVWSVFCDVFSHDVKVDRWSLVGVVFVDLGFYLTLVAVCFSLAYIKPLVRLLKLTRADVISILYVGSTKNIALGFPLITAVYTNSPHVGMLATPLLILIAEQNFLGGCFVRPLRKWRARDENHLNDKQLPM